MIRKIAKKWLYGVTPGFRGSFPYFGCRVFFPPRSAAFLITCEQGVFEADNIRLLQRIYRPSTFMFDVGANIGLMAIPILRTIDASKVVSFEPSPNALPWLQRTVAGSPFRDRWSIVPRAAADFTGSALFSVGKPRLGLFDGLKPTGRVAEAGQVEVELTTIDREWDLLGQPPVSVIKIDVEGAELSVLRGATRCLAATRPHVLVEWNTGNLEAYECAPAELLSFAADNECRLYGLPNGVAIATPLELAMQMVKAESFLLTPVIR